ncbi:3'-5' exonuclease [Acetobacter sacchari]|uniref:3'-5' exonuclease n=1 Tax=Acetobacter sacchari TaxID=2661687 RepID=A0ABS3M014_9PROT|nr:3'-5' exonuclease [Acetobacter sacchari]MBO1361509.1 3'-5' exonuclease [Acetobacter sacchari]
MIWILAVVSIFLSLAVGGRRGRVSSPRRKDSGRPPAHLRPASGKIRIQSDLGSRAPLTLRYVEKPLFIDVETTGLHSTDRIVTLAMIKLISRHGCSIKISTSHFIFDPMKKSHPEAEKVHGIDDWVLRHQQIFLEKIEEIKSIISDCDAIVCHNSDFDLKFLKAEFEKCGSEFPNIETQCTMREAQAQGQYPASLASCAARIGFRLDRINHDAAQDAYLCAAIWCRAFGIVLPTDYATTKIPYENILEVPERPSNLPRRDNKKKLHNVRKTMTSV